MTKPTVQLARQLSLWGVIVFGISYMAPTIALATFGVIANLSNGVTPVVYVLATAVMALTAASYGKLARLYPASGSIYTYAANLLGPKIGFLAGWIILLDYFFLPMVAWLITAVYFHVEFAFMPVWAWGVVIIALCTLINIIGLRVADRINRTLLLVVLLTLGAVVVIGVRYVLGHSVPITGAFSSPSASLGTTIAAAAVAAYSFLGFDAVSTLSEEVVDAKRNVPKGIILVVIIGGTIFIITTFVMQWAHPGGSFENAGSGGYETLSIIGGPKVAQTINLILVIGAIPSCIAVQASGSRLMYVMGRDGVFPRRLFGTLSARFRTPTFNILLMAVIGCAGQFLTVRTATSFINFGAFIAFALANVCVVVLWARRYEFSLRPATVVSYVLMPVAGFVVDVFLLLKLGGDAKIIGLSWAILGIIYLLVITKGLRVEPPHLAFSDDSV